jgi:hypothetical protein
MLRMFGLLFVCGFNPLNAQDISIKSNQLDRLIWSKINDQLASMNKKPIASFEDSLLRDYGSRWAEHLMPWDTPFEHSDSLSWWTNGSECIYKYSQVSTSNNEYINAIEEGNLEMIAEKAFRAWVESPSHNYQISKDAYWASTVSTLIVYNKNKGEFRLTAVWLSMYNPRAFICGSRYSWIF